MLLKFFRVFVDGRHYGKDKNLLFPLPEAKGIPREEEDL
jgi:hemerythrin-like domain-containing protein